MMFIFTAYCCLNTALAASDGKAEEKLERPPKVVKKKKHKSRTLRATGVDGIPLPISANYKRENRTVVIDHFNDCYKSEDAPRYKHFLDFKMTKPEDCVRVFGGDLFGPNTFKEWKTITDCGLEMGIDLAAMGNHECDYGYPEYIKANDYLQEKKGFKFLMSNVFLDVPAEDIKRYEEQSVPIPKHYMIGGDDTTEDRRGYCEPHTIKEVNGLKIGFIAYADDSWHTKMGFQFKRKHKLYIEDPVVAIERNLKELEGKCELIVLVSHSNWPTDVKVAQELTKNKIDMILTGHDHFLRIENIDGIPVLNSGSHFKWFTRTYITKTKAHSFSTGPYRGYKRKNNKDRVLRKGEEYMKAEDNLLNSPIKSIRENALKLLTNKYDETDEGNVDYVEEDDDVSACDLLFRNFKYTKTTYDATGEPLNHYVFDIDVFCVNKRYEENMIADNDHLCQKKGIHPVYKLMQHQVDQKVAQHEQEMGVAIARAAEKLDFQRVRETEDHKVAKETLKALLYHDKIKADCAMLQSGAFRSKAIIEKGFLITKGDIMSNIPYTDEKVVTMEISIANLKKIVERSRALFNTKTDPANCMQFAGINYTEDGILTVPLAKKRGKKMKGDENKDTVRLATTQYLIDCLPHQNKLLFRSCMKRIKHKNPDVNDTFEFVDKDGNSLVERKEEELVHNVLASDWEYKSYDEWSLFDAFVYCCGSVGTDADGKVLAKFPFPVSGAAGADSAAGSAAGASSAASS